MIAPVLTRVINSGTQRALLCTAIHGSDARSARTWIGRIDALNASVKPILPSVVAVDFDEGAAPVRPERGAPTSSPAPSMVSAGSVWVAARWRRRASARSVLLARATVSPAVGGSGMVERIVVQRR